MIPIVSVIIPTYNGEAYIEQAIASVLAQSETGLELIIVDDASSDHTVTCIKRFSDSRLHLFENEKNLGGGAARNVGMRHARGEWIAFLDHDDWYAEDRLARLLDYARHYDVDMIADNIQFVDLHQPAGSDETTARFHSAGTLFFDKMVQSLPRTISAAEFILGNRPGPRNPCLGLIKPIFRRSFIERHGLHWYAGVAFGDTSCYLQCLAEGGRLLLVPEATYNYRRHHDGLTGSTDVLDMLNMRAKQNKRLMLEYAGSEQELVRALETRQRAIERAVRHEQMKRRLQRAAYMEAALAVRELPAFVSYLGEEKWSRLRARLNRAFKHIRA